MAEPKIFLNAILKWDEPIQMVKRALDSIKDYVDGLYVAVTYNEEKPKEDSPLPKLLRTYGANVLFFKWVDDFAIARQFVMDNTPHGKNHFITWLDTDDVAKDPQNLRLGAQIAVENNIAAIHYPYWYMVDLDKDGNVREIVIEHSRERLIRNDGTFKWIGSLHETLIEQRMENVIKVMRKDYVVVHLSTNERADKNMERNIKILEKQVAKEERKDPRTLIYLAKAYFDKARFYTKEDEKKIYYDLALNLFTEFLEGTGKPGTVGYQEGSGFAEERATAWHFLSEIFRLNNKYNTAIKAMHNAIIEAPHFPQYYVDMAMIWAILKDYKKAKHWLRVATTIPQPETTIIVTPRDLKTRALEVDYNIALAEGRLDQAEKDSEKLIEIMPDVQGLKDRYTLIQSLNSANKTAQSIVYIGKYLEDIKEPEKISHLIEAIPRDLQQEKFVSEMRHKFIPPYTWKNNEVTILCGQGFEKWSPKSVKTGIGGSEQAVIYLADELTKLGWKVTVYADPREDIGEHRGVTYKQWYDINLKDEFNVLILWRNIGFVDFNPKAKFTMVWMHDVPLNPDFTKERVDKIDKIAVLSEFHKGLFRMSVDGELVPMPEEKFFLTANGMPQINANKKWFKERSPYRMLYTSSPDRGLVNLLKMWPDIKKEVPEAELNIFYGFHVFDAIHQNNPAKMKWKQQVLEMMKQDGITYHGRIGHAELNKWFAKSGIFAYFCTFEEISCISSMSAQALGAIPVVTNYAALKETVKNGIKVDVNPFTEEGQEAYKQALTGILKDHKKQEELRGPMMKFAMGYFGWPQIAQRWAELFETELEKKKGQGGDKDARNTKP